MKKVLCRFPYLFVYPQEQDVDEIVKVHEALSASVFMSSRGFWSVEIKNTLFVADVKPVVTTIFLLRPRIKKGVNFYESTLSEVIYLERR